MKEAVAELARILSLVFLLSAIVFACAHIEPIHAADVESVKQLAVEAAEAEGLDPLLVLAIMKVESNFNVKARGSLGEIGVFQLRPEFHPVIEGNAAHNIAVGARYLAHVIRVCSPHYGPAAFVCFNLGPHRATKLQHPTRFPYYLKVQQAYEELASNER